MRARPRPSAQRVVDLLAKRTPKAYPGFSHGMLTVNADVLNADLLAFTTGYATRGAASAPRLSQKFPTGTILPDERIRSMSIRQAISADNQHVRYKAHGYPAAVRSSDHLLVSGQVGSLPDGSPEPDFAKRVKLAFQKLEAVLTPAGACRLAARASRACPTRFPGTQNGVNS